jgi:hypothetical protein
VRLDVYLSREFMLLFDGIAPRDVSERLAISAPPQRLGTLVRR